MAISLVAVTTPTGIAAANATITVSLAGDGVAQNDVIVAIHGAGGTLTPGNPTDYTSVQNATNLSLGYLIAGASPPSDVVFPAPGASSIAHEAIVYVLRGVDTNDPSDATPTTSGTTDPAAITPDNNGACVICAVSSRTRDTSPGGNDGTNDLSAIGPNVTSDSTMVASVYLDVTTSGVDPGAFSSLTSITPTSITTAWHASAAQPQTITVNQTSETDAATAAAHPKTTHPGYPTETETALDARPGRSYVIGQAW